MREVAERARAASRGLAVLGLRERDAALAAMAVALAGARERLVAANVEDLRLAREFVGGDAVSPAVAARLALTEVKLAEMAEGIRSVARLPDPLGRLLDAVELDDGDPLRSAEARASEANPLDRLDKLRAEAEAPRFANTGLHLQKVSVPLGVLLVIFEARPDAVTQIASLALKSGNAVILKPGREVERTAAVLVEVLRGALRSEGIAEDAVSLVLGREQAAELLTMHDLVDLVIPRGSKALVEYVQAHTRIPVLGHAEGVCHLYVDRAADPELALRVIADAKVDYPAACNAVETVLVHREIAESFLPVMAERLRGLGVRLRGSEAARALLRGGGGEIAPVADWHTEFGEAELAIGIVASTEEAIAHIHRHGSSHTEGILTEDGETAERFLREVDAAGVFHNVSTRFADGFRYGFGAEVGVSTSKFHARGPVGLEGLTSYKYLLRGHGHVAGEYRGAGARVFTHRRESSGR